ncbi:MAG: hypothetical protein CYPHOPRED_005950 [Cyphobasidiales sp. Tagirdzhanova-0007]|nr:MAG: hypothetical protein CYPHOPRED_005950 [Cyphobasidiales sp. Tagirdzhanova-0007]
MRAFSRFVRPVASQAIGSIHHSVRPVASSYPRTAASPLFLQLRRASGASLSKDDISSRILVVLKSFEKVDPTKVDAESSFTGDLGLDSLDAVEVVMAIEEEFSIEIPDDEVLG